MCLLTPLALKPCTFKPGSLTPALTSDLTLERAWTHPPNSAPDFVTEALRMKRSNLRRSASHGELAAVTWPRLRTAARLGLGTGGALRSEGWAPRQASAECPEDSDPEGPCCLLEGGSPAVEGHVVVPASLES